MHEKVNFKKCKAKKQNKTAEPKAAPFDLLTLKTQP